MKLSRCTHAWLAIFATCLAAAARAEAPRLFEGDEPLTIELEARWDPIRHDRAPEPSQYPATLSYTAPSGEVRLPISLEPSGRSRRTMEICELPPLRLSIPKAERDDSLFQGIGEFKLVTHCRNNANYEANLLLEYLVYRAYRLVTDESHRVRLLRVRYREPGRTRPRWERFGFAIEDASNLAKRIGAERIAESKIDPERLDPLAASRAEMFFYMIGMTDFSLIQRNGGPCCHNARALRRTDGSIVPVPFDFDQTGVVNPEYALPDERLGIRRVTQRKFRGQCRPAAVSGASIGLLREKRAAIRALFQAESALPPPRVERAIAFLDGFYAWADDPQRVEKTLAEECAQHAR